MASSAIPAPSPFRRLLAAWLPSALWLALISQLSSDSFSAAHTGSVLRWMVQTFYGDISPTAFQTIHIFVRKAAHFSVYGVLSWLAFRSWRVTLPFRYSWRFQWSLLALGLTLVAASLDEFHQIFVPSRTASFHDVTLDMMGAVFVQILIACAPFKKNFTTD